VYVYKYVGKEGDCDANSLNYVPALVVFPLGPIVVLCLVKEQKDGRKEKNGQETTHHQVEDYRPTYLVAQRDLKEDVHNVCYQRNRDNKASNYKVDPRNAQLFGLELRLYHFHPVHVVMLLKVDKVVETEPLEDLDADRQVLDDRLRSQDELCPAVLYPALIGHIVYHFHHQV
jgi:hypothetical protein